MYVSVQISKKTRDAIEICKDIFMDYHPEFEKHHLSNHKILWECVKFYIKTESKFKHKLIECDKYER